MIYPDHEHVHAYTIYHVFFKLQNALQHNGSAERTAMETFQSSESSPMTDALIDEYSIHTLPHKIITSSHPQVLLPGPLP